MDFKDNEIYESNNSKWSDVEKSLKELHKRLIRMEKGLESGGSHNKAYSTGTDYSAKNKKDKDLERAVDSIERDDKLRNDLEQLKKDLDL